MIWMNGRRARNTGGAQSWYKKQLEKERQRKADSWAQLKAASDVRVGRHE